jgi:hypothetical protein
METSTEPNAIIPASTTTVATTGFSQEIIDALADYAGDDMFVEGELLTLNGKTGEWSQGRNPSIPVEAGRIIVADVPNALFGFIQFRGKGEPPVQKYWPIPLFNYERCRATLPNNDPAHWQRHKKTNLPEDPMSHAIVIPSYDPATKEKLRLAFNSKSGVRTTKRFINTCLKNLKAAPATTAGCLPVIQIGSRPFDTDEGTSFAPVLEFIDWFSASDLLLPSEPGAGQEPPADDAFEQEPEPQQPVPLKRKSNKKK